MCGSMHTARSHFVQPFLTIWDLRTISLWISHDTKMALGPLMPEFFIHEEIRTKTHPMAFYFQPEGFVWFPLLPCKGYKGHQTVPFHSTRCINKLKTSCSNLINLHSPRKSFLISFAVICNFWISPRYLMPQNRILLSWLTTSKALQKNAVLCPRRPQACSLGERSGSLHIFSYLFFYWPGID